MCDLHFEIVFHLGGFETLLRKHGVPLTVLEVEPRGRRLHWHQGRHLCNFETVVIHSFDWLGQLHTGKYSFNILCFTDQERGQVSHCYGLNIL